MTDFKTAATRDQEEISDQFMNEMQKQMSDHARRLGHTLEFLEGALGWIVRQTKATMEPKERLQALLKLSQVPRWKLLRIVEFSSPFMNEIWKFFDELRLVPETYVAPALEEPKSGIAADCRKYTDRLLGDKLSNTEKDKLELDFVTAMREKYPRLRWTCGRKANIRE